MCLSEIKAGEERRETKQRQVGSERLFWVEVGRKDMEHVGEGKETGE